MQFCADLHKPTVLSPLPPTQSNLSAAWNVNRCPLQFVSLSSLMIVIKVHFLLAAQRGSTEFRK